MTPACCPTYCTTRSERKFVGGLTASHIDTKNLLRLLQVSVLRWTRVSDLLKVLELGSIEGSLVGELNGGDSRMLGTLLEALFAAEPVQPRPGNVSTRGNTYNFSKASGLPCAVPTTSPLCMAWSTASPDSAHDHHLWDCEDPLTGSFFTHPTIPCWCARSLANARKNTPCTLPFTR